MKEMFQQYTKDAIRTESQIDKVRLNPLFLMSVLNISKAAGNMLDQMKKHAYYGKDYNEEHIMLDFGNIINGLEGIKQSHPNLAVEEELAVDPRVFHSILGIATESTELLEALDIYGGTMDSVNLLEESFDIDWYQFILMDALGGDLQLVWDAGIAKLKARYPDNFTSENALDRDLDAERDILEELKRPLDDLK